MTQPTFAPLADALTASLHRPLTDPVRLLSILKRVEDATGNCLGLQVPPGRDVIGGSVETFSGREDWSLYPCMSNANGACLRFPKSNAPPNYPVPTRPRPTEMIPNATAWPLELDACARWGHGCLLELHSAAIITFGSVDWMNTFFNFALCIRLGATGSSTEKLYHLLSRLSMRFAKKLCAPVRRRRSSTHTLP